MDLMKIVIFIHLGVGAWIYSNPIYYPHNYFYVEENGKWTLNGYY